MAVLAGDGNLRERVAMMLRSGCRSHLRVIYAQVEMPEGKGRRAAEKNVIGNGVLLRRPRAAGDGQQRTTRNLLSSANRPK